MTEELYILPELAEKFVEKGFDGGTENITRERIIRWLRDSKAVHLNIQPCLERDGSVKYFLKSIIDHSAELTFKKKKFDTYEACADDIFEKLARALN